MNDIYPDVRPCPVIPVHTLERLSRMCMLRPFLIVNRNAASIKCWCILRSGQIWLDLRRSPHEDNTTRDTIKNEKTMSTGTLPRKEGGSVCRMHTFLRLWSRGVVRDSCCCGCSRQISPELVPTSAAVVSTKHLERVLGMCVSCF